MHDYVSKEVCGGLPSPNTTSASKGLSLVPSFARHRGQTKYSVIPLFSRMDIDQTGVAREMAPNIACPKCRWIPICCKVPPTHSCSHNIKLALQGFKTGICPDRGNPVKTPINIP